MHKWVNGRPTKVQSTTRPDTILPEKWPRLPKKQEPEEIAAWDEEKIRLQEEARRKRGVFDVSSKDPANLKVISEARTKLERCAVPSMQRNALGKPTLLAHVKR